MSSSFGSGESCLCSDRAQSQEDVVPTAEVAASLHMESVCKNK